MVNFSTIATGSKYSESFKTYVTADNEIISPFHDIPYLSGKFVNCVNEIPRFEHAKFEITKNQDFNPIMQDIKKGKVRFVKNVFPMCGYPFNYGAIPQTWENPKEKDERIMAFGDNDPIDVIEIGSKRKSIGQVYQAKVLGAFALVDEDEADWKIIVIDSTDILAEKLNSKEDIEKHMPGLINHIFIWLRDYKLPDGKSENMFGLGGEFLDASVAKQVIEETHLNWKKMITNGYDKISTANRTNKDSKHFLSSPVEIYCKEQKDAECPEDLMEYSYVTK